MSNQPRGRKNWRTTGVVVALTIALGATAAGCSSSSSSQPSNHSTTLNVALTVQDKPNYIFPFVSGAYFTVTNLNDFQSLMFRPLYWFGRGSDITVQYPLSPANQPVFSNANKTITIALKGWKFADGTTVDAQAVKFFLNLQAALPTKYAGYVPGFGIPDQVASVTTPDASTVVMTMKEAVNPDWFLYNFLSQPVPLPLAWDKTTLSAKPGSGGCSSAEWNSAAAKTACTKVYTFLNAQSLDLSTYASSPLWQVVDGPWKLSGFVGSSGQTTMVPNTAYSGPQQAQMKKMVFHPFTSIQAETNALEAGSIDLGYSQPSDVNTAPEPGVAGTNKLSQLSNFNVRTGGTWSFNYAYYNYNSASSGTHLVNQLYIRQALQYGLNQTQIIKSLYNGYGVPTYGPIPTLPANDFSKGVGNPYPYNTAAGKALLQANGWNTAAFPASCTRASGCGVGVPTGTKLALTYVYSSGSPTLDSQMSAETSAWRSEGIQVTLSARDANSVASLCTAGSSNGTPTGPNGNWQICQYGGWLYAPDYYPSGELLFQTGALSNPGEYSDSKMDALIASTTKGTAALNDGYAQYAAQQLPYLYQPTGTGVGQASKSLKGLLPVSPLQAFLPEYISK